MRRFWFAILLSLPLAVSAAATPTAGKEYTVLESQHASSGKTIQVLEFFSYGCPWCYHFESHLEKWLAHQPKDVAFSRVPAEFRPSWTLLAKTYYAAETLGVEKQVTPDLFRAIHGDNPDRPNGAEGDNITKEAITAIFKRHGVTQASFESAFAGATFSNKRRLYNTFKVYRVPTIVVDGHYSTNPGAAGGYDKVIHVLDFLIQKARQDKQQHATKTS